MNPGEAAGGEPEPGPSAARVAPEANEVALEANEVALEANEVAPEAAQRGLDPGGLLYGTIVSAAALAIGAIRGDTVGEMTETMVTTLLIYWIAHAYVATVSGRRPGGAVPLHRLIETSARHEASIPLGGLPVVIVAVILGFTHVSPWAVVLSDLGVVIVMLALGGLVAGLYAGTRGWRLGVEAASAAVLGGLIAVLLVLLHRH